MPVEFPNETTFEWCDETVTMAGPLHNEVAPPGPRDNNSIWYEDTTPELYNELYFGVGPDAGVIVNHPNLGEVDLRGNTMANYYLEQSEGKFLPVGTIYPKWLQAAYAEGWYGADNCTGSNHNVRAADLVEEVVDAVNVDDPTFDWQDFDGDGDGFVDNFTVIHAGAGQEGGGGAQGSFAIWSHASALNPPTGHLACTAGSAGCPDRDIFVRSYSMDPEMIDIGVIAEEFGHAAFGLPDIYTTDYQASPSNWAIMEAGSWNGSWRACSRRPSRSFSAISSVGRNPVEIDYDTATTTVKVGQHSIRPLNTEQGLKINLPDQVIETPNPLGTGNAWWSDRADLADIILAHDFDLAGDHRPDLLVRQLLELRSGLRLWLCRGLRRRRRDLDHATGYGWDLRRRWRQGNLGLNGEGEGTLRFDLAAYAGKQITCACTTPATWVCSGQAGGAMTSPWMMAPPTCSSTM